MVNIIKADIYRILKRKGFYACFIFIILMLGISIFLKQPGHMGLNVNTDTNLIEEMENIESIGDAYDLLQSNSSTHVDADIMATAGNLYYFFIFVTFVVICTDLANHTAKNVIASGISRQTYYLSKLLLVCGIGTIYILFHTYAGYFGNLLYNGSAYSSSLGDVTIIMLRQLPILYGIMSILVMLSVIIQKTAIFNAVTIVLVMAVQLLIMILSAIFKFDSSIIVQFEFESIIRSLAVLGDVSTKVLLTGIGTGVVMFVASTIAGLQYFKKCTIK